MIYYYTTTTEEMGIEKGMFRGMTQGILQGMEQGLNEGYREGVYTGILQTTQKFVLRMIAKDYNENKINDIIYVSKEEVNRLIKEGAC